MRPGGGQRPAVAVPPDPVADAGRLFRSQGVVDHGEAALALASVVAPGRLRTLARRDEHDEAALPDAGAVVATLTPSRESRCPPSKASNRPTARRRAAPVAAHSRAIVRSASRGAAPSPRRRLPDRRRGDGRSRSQRVHRRRQRRSPTGLALVISRRLRGAPVRREGCAPSPSSCRRRLPGRDASRPASWLIGSRRAPCSTGRSSPSSRWRHRDRSSARPLPP